MPTTTDINKDLDTLKEVDAPLARSSLSQGFTDISRPRTSTGTSHMFPLSVDVGLDEDVDEPQPQSLSLTSPTETITSSAEVMSPKLVAEMVCMP